MSSDHEAEIRASVATTVTALGSMGLGVAATAVVALLREGDGVAAQILVASGLDLNRVRQQVLELTHGPHQAGAERAPAPGADDDLLERLTSIAARLDAIERRLMQSASG
jgi:hypothetical protein